MFRCNHHHQGAHYLSLQELIIYAKGHTLHVKYDKLLIHVSYPAKFVFCWLILLLLILLAYLLYFTLLYFTLLTYLLTYFTYLLTYLHTYLLTLLTYLLTYLSLQAQIVRSLMIVITPKHVGAVLM